MSETTTMIIEYTEADFISSSKPYDYLWGLRGNPFKQQQELTRLAQIAKKLKLGSKFLEMWKQYLITKNPGRQTLESANVTEFPDQELALKCHPYYCDNLGVFSYDQNGNEVQVCAHPIMPTKRIVNLDNGECKTELAWYRDFRWHHQIFGEDVLGNAQKITALRTVGIGVNTSNALDMVKYIGTLTDNNWETLPMRQSIGRLGWMEHGFSPYVPDVLFDGNEQYRHAFEAVRTGGSFEAWRDCISKYYRNGESVPARMMIAGSLSSVLVGPLQALPFILHVWSNTSGNGKTVTTMAAASVWARPQMGEYAKSYNTTNVGIEMLAGFYADMPLCIDELELKNGRRDTFDAMIYNFCEGVGRLRGSKAGGLQKTLTWHNCMISTGEEPLTSGNSKAGAINRVLDINAGSAKLASNLPEIASVLAANHGWAGELFVKSLQAEGAMAEVKAIQDAFYAQLDKKCTDKQRLSASIILAADAWATKVLFQDDRALTVEDVVPFLQSEAATDVNQRAYEWLMDMVSVNSARFSTTDNNGEVWGVVEEGEKRVYIIKSVFDRIMEDEGYNSTGFLSWAKAKKLIKTEDGHNTVKKGVGSGKVKTRCVALRMDDTSPSMTDPDTGYVVVDDEPCMFDLA